MAVDRPGNLRIAALQQANVDQLLDQLGCAAADDDIITRDGMARLTLSHYA